mmetsp:Transcript_71908/g.208279  ORF Transcript_71908/g.208279 Transcript_71908/m.208279 type:complete len:225 (+) Transcript_71908:1006-1680(+)
MGARVPDRRLPPKVLVSDHDPAHPRGGQDVGAGHGVRRTARAHVPEDGVGPIAVVGNPRHERLAAGDELRVGRRHVQPLGHIQREGADQLREDPLGAAGGQGRDLPHEHLPTLRGVHQRSNQVEAHRQARKDRVQQPGAQFQVVPHGSPDTPARASAPSAASARSPPRHTRSAVSRLWQRVGTPPGCCAAGLQSQPPDACCKTHGMDESQTSERRRGEGERATH